MQTYPWRYLRRVHGTASFEDHYTDATTEPADISDVTGLQVAAKYLANHFYNTYNLVMLPSHFKLRRMEYAALVLAAVSV